MNAEARFSEEAQAKRKESKRTAKNVNEIFQKPRLDTSPAQERQILERLSEMPESYRRGYLRAMKGGSAAAAIKSHCLECMGWSRQDIPGCTAGACALFPYRPFQGD